MCDEGRQLEHKLKLAACLAYTCLGKIQHPTSSVLECDQVFSSYQDSKSAKSGENGTDDGEMDVWGLAEG